MDDKSQRSIVANIINHDATFREKNKINARNLHNQLIVFVKSKAQPDNILVVKPDNIAIRLAIDEIRKNNEHGFLRSVRCDKTSVLRRFPIIPNRNRNIEK
jgi:hypothetical protein